MNVSREKGTSDFPSSQRSSVHAKHTSIISVIDVSFWPFAYESEQHRFWRDCAEAQARLNLCCSHMLKRPFFPWRSSNKYRVFSKYTDTLLLIILALKIEELIFLHVDVSEIAGCVSNSMQPDPTPVSACWGLSVPMLRAKSVTIRHFSQNIYKKANITFYPEYSVK